ncbi:uncharacterized protein LOC115371246 [Myripristis murdjan]|uniref:uncharacterized protein LOC115371246 n=1 Tax=Myripristis murdjan TaxID=586833 RepID=UPI0011761164|nr:uncharacterized protein LOC115371246 [Myripristis murdjan]
METRYNRRKIKENYCAGQHLKLPDLKKTAKSSGIGNQYLYKENIPPYPRPELHVSHLKHDTDKRGLKGISADEGFRAAFRGSLVWWSLAVTPEEISSAEERLLKEAFPEWTEEQAKGQENSLAKFATSPAFLKTSRFGSYRFTLPLRELLTAYSQQFCDGSAPVLRVFETVLYKQEVVYSVLVHSRSNNQLFHHFPLLRDDPDAVCAYRDGRFIWRPEAMCETHSYELTKNPDQNGFEVNFVYGPPFYVWDNVAVAFHVDDAQVLQLDESQLRESLSFCKGAAPPLAKFQSFEDATELVQELWPGDSSPLKGE